MTRHVKVLMKKTFNDNIETDSGTLAKAVYDTVNGKTVIGMSVTKFGQNSMCIIIYDDA